MPALQIGHLICFEAVRAPTTRLTCLLSTTGAVDTEETADSIWASSDVPAPIWIEWVSLPASSSESESRLSNTDSSALRIDNTGEEIDETVPATEAASRLARLTVYWPGEGDHYTGRRMSSTGVYLVTAIARLIPRSFPMAVS